MALAAAAADLVVDLLERAGGAADQDQVRALPGVGQRHGAADAAGGPRDEGKAAGEALWGWSWHWCRTRLPETARLQGPTPLLQPSVLRHGVPACRGADTPRGQFFFGASAPLDFSISSLALPGRRRRPSAPPPCSCRSRAWPPRRRARPPAWPGRWPPWPPPGLLGVGLGLLARLLGGLQHLLGAHRGQLLGALDETLEQGLLGQQRARLHRRHRADEVGLVLPGLLALTRVSGVPVNTTSGVQAVTTLRADLTHCAFSTCVSCAK